MKHKCIHYTILIKEVPSGGRNVSYLSFVVILAIVNSTKEKQLTSVYIKNRIT